jgi:hypothetical protein
MDLIRLPQQSAARILATDNGRGATEIQIDPGHRQLF